MDIAARNVLVGKDNLVKISDFGMTKKLPSTSLEFIPTISIKVPVKWCAIEILEERRFSEASDVWACGVLLWEIMSRGAQPFEGILQANIAKYLKQGNRLAPPPLGYAPLYKIAQRCWMEKRQERPTFEVLNAEIKKLLRDLTKQNPDVEIRDLAATLAARKDPRVATSTLKKAASSIVLDMADDGPDLPAVPSPAAAKVTPSAVAAKVAQKSFRKTKEKTPPASTMTPADVGKRCVVLGYDSEGVVAYFGPTQGKASEVTCGVVLDRKIGRNNGTVRGHKYFECEQGFGVMCNPDKITLLTTTLVVNTADPYESPLSPSGPTADVKSKLKIEDDVPATPGAADDDDDDEKDQNDESKWVMGADDEDLQEPDPTPASPSKVQSAESSLSKAMQDMNLEDEDDVKRRLSFLGGDKSSESSSSLSGRSSMTPAEKAERRKQIEEEVAAKLASDDDGVNKSLRAGMRASRASLSGDKGALDPSVLRSTFHKPGSDAEKPTGSGWCDDDAGSPPEPPKRGGSEAKDKKAAGVTVPEEFGFGS
jgi:serine/threonine protein kinase